MKIFTAISTFLLSAQFCFSQGDSIPPVPNETIYTVVEDMPEFPGGETALREYLSKHIRYPNTAKEEGIEGKVYVRFIVTEKGDIIGTEVLRGVRKDLDDAALAVIKEMPNWKPGKQNGRAVSVYFMIPINFTLKAK